MNTIYSYRRDVPEDGNRHAFTLVELMAVLVTIALLGALVWPALANSNDNGTRTVCVNNLRQLGTALTLYANENRDYIAHPNWGNSYPGWLYSPTNGAPPSLTTGAYATNPVAAYRTGLWFQYVNNPRAYLCPADVDSKYFMQRANQFSTYIMNGAVCGYGLMNARTCRITDAWAPNCYLLWEPDENLGSPPMGAFVYNDASSFPDKNEGMGRLHMANGGQILTVDGAVRCVSSQRFSTEQTATGRSLAWWSSYSSNGH